MQTKRTALVTGASGGIGEAFARLLAREGFDLILTARNGARLEALAGELERLSAVSVRWVAADLEQPGAVDQIIVAMGDAGMEVELLVNNAGFGEYGRFAEIGGNSQAMIRVLIGALTELTARILPCMIERGRGGVINVGSTGSLVPCPNMAVYGAAKAYVLSFTEALAIELKGTGITATALLPGNTRTGFAERAGTGHTCVARSMSMPPQAVARAGYDAWRRGRTVAVAGCGNKVMMRLAGLLPRCAVNAVTRRILAA